MKLNHDCVREILLSVEELPKNGYYAFDDLVQKLPSYSSDEIEYCCLKLNEGGFIDINTVIRSRSIYPSVTAVYHMTFKGHEFLDTIRTDTAWDRIKDTALHFGSVSLSGLMQIGQSLLTSYLKNYLKI